MGIGRRAGPWPRRSGVAEFMERAARIKVAAVPRSRQLRPLRSHTIARRGSRMGWQVGLWPRRHGAVQTRARAAHRQLEGAPEPRLVEWLMHDLRAGLGAIFQRYGMLSRKQVTPSGRARHSLASALAPSSGASCRSLLSVVWRIK